MVIEGPPGTGKSTLLREIARDTGQAVIFVEGNAELTPARLIGQHDPAQVLAGGYTPASFTDGPLLTAMRGGALLYLEEFNRIPEETLNVLITVLAEGEIAVPRLGMVRAGDGFRLIAAMNPFDAIGTARVSQAVADRICRVVLGYQDAAAERDITTAVSGGGGPGVAFAVELTRATRVHPDIRMGASVRGAIDLVLLLTGLARLRGEHGMAWATARDAAYAALSGRIRIADGCDRSPESVLDELLAGLWPAGRRSARPVRATVPAAGPRRPAAREKLTACRRLREAPASARSGPACAGTGGGARPGAPPAGPSWLPGTPRSATCRRRSASWTRPRWPGCSSRTRTRPRPCSRTWRWPPTGHWPRRRGGWPRGCSSGSRPAAAARPAAPGGSGPAAATATWTWTAPWTGVSGSWPPPPADLVTRTWQARRRALCLLIDTSGSMSGLAVAIAAVAASAVMLAAGGRHDAGVIAFSSEVSELHPPGSGRPPGELVGELVALRGHGTTDLAAALRAAARQLAGCRADERMVILLSDCLRTAGGDPAAALAGIDRLQVLCPLPSGPDQRSRPRPRWPAAAAGSASRSAAWRTSARR